MRFIFILVKSANLLKNMFKGSYLHFFSCCCLCILAQTISAQLPNSTNKANRRYMVDFTKSITAGELLDLDQQLKVYEREANVQIVAAITNAREGISESFFAAALYQKWKIGALTQKNGILLLAIKKDSLVDFAFHIGEGARTRITPGKIKRLIKDRIYPILVNADTLNYYQALLKGTMYVFNVYQGFPSNLNQKTQITQQGDFLAIWNNMLSVEDSRKIEKQLADLHQSTGLRIVVDMCQRGNNDIGMQAVVNRKKEIYTHLEQTYGKEVALKTIIILIESYTEVSTSKQIQNYIHVFQADSDNGIPKSIKQKLQALQKTYATSTHYRALLKELVVIFTEYKEKKIAIAKQQQWMTWVGIAVALLLFILLLGLVWAKSRRKQLAFYHQLLKDSSWQAWEKDYTSLSIQIQKNELQKLFKKYRGSERKKALHDHFQLLKGSPQTHLDYKPVFELNALQQRLEKEREELERSHFVYCLNFIRKAIQFFAKKEDLKLVADSDRYQSTFFTLYTFIGFSEKHRSIYWRSYQRIRRIIAYFEEGDPQKQKFLQSPILENLPALLNLEREVIHAYIRAHQQVGQVATLYTYASNLYPIIERLLAHRSFSVEQIMMKEEFYKSLGVEVDKATDLQLYLNKMYRGRDYFSLVSGATLSKSDTSYHKTIVKQYENILARPREELYLNVAFYKNELKTYAAHPNKFWTALEHNYTPIQLETLKKLYQQRMEEIEKNEYPIGDLIDFYFYYLKFPKLDK